MSRTDELIRLAEGATPGPWEFKFPNVYCERIGWPVARLASTMGSAGTEARNGAYIAAANPQTIKQMALLMQQMAEAANYTVLTGEGLTELNEALAAYERFEKEIEDEQHHT